MSTKKERRIAIFKDVIKQVRARRIKPSQGCYLEPIGGQVTGVAEDSLSTLLKGKRCEACAKGALMLAAVDRYDRLNLAEIGRLVETPSFICSDPSCTQCRPGREARDPSCTQCRPGREARDAALAEKGETLRYRFHGATEEDTVATLSEFKQEELDQIENAFEKWTDRDPAAAAFGRKYRSASARLIAICKNAIRNGGKFKPPSLRA